MNQFINDEDMNQEYIDQYNNTFVNNSEYFKYSGIYINLFIQYLRYSKLFILLLL